MLRSLLGGLGDYLGVKIPNMPLILGGHFLFRVATDPIPLALVVAFSGVILTRFIAGELRKRWLIAFGLLSYCAFSAFLLVQAPGAMVSFPILRLMPFMYGFLLLGGIPCLLFVALFHSVGALRLSVVWLVVIVATINLPHDIFRVICDGFKTPIRAAEPRFMMFVIDAARYDDVQAALPPEYQKSLGLGVSHFGSTRKQWRLLLSGDLERTARSFFLPTREEKGATNSATLLTEIARRAGLRTCFLIDDPRTVSRNSLGIQFSEFKAPSLGMLDSILAEITLFPVCGWLWNVQSPVEGANHWSQTDVFLRDTARALRSHHIVFAHNLTLQRGLSSWEDFDAVYGKAWLQMRPTVCRLVNERQAGVDGVDALYLYRHRMKNLLALLLPWSEQVVSQHNVSGIFTSDHGQEFILMEGGEKHYAGLHGWDLSPDVIWTPVLPFGRSRLAGDADGHISWLDLRNAILEWIDSPQLLNLRRTMDTTMLSTHFIAKSQLSSEPLKPISSELITVQRIIGSLELDWSEGAFLNADFASKPYLISTGMAKGSLLDVTNPTNSGEMVRTKWHLYQRLIDDRN